MQIRSQIISLLISNQFSIMILIIALYLLSRYTKRDFIMIPSITSDPIYVGKQILPRFLGGLNRT